MNRVIIIGNLSRDPDSGQTVNGVAWCRFNVAVSRRYTDDNGNRPADFFNVVAWRGLASTCAKYLAKGRKVSVEGRLETRSYDGEDGQRHYTTEIVADSVEFLGRRGGGSADPDPDEMEDA